MKTFRLKATSFVFVVYERFREKCVTLLPKNEFGEPHHNIKKGVDRAIVAACRLFDQHFPIEPVHTNIEVEWTKKKDGSITFYGISKRYAEIFDTGRFYWKRGLYPIIEVSKIGEVKEVTITPTNRSFFDILLKMRTRMFPVPLLFKYYKDEKFHFIPDEVFNGNINVVFQRIVVDPNGEWIRYRDKVYTHGSYVPEEWIRYREEVTEKIAPYGWRISDKYFLRRANGYCSTWMD